MAYFKSISSLDDLKKKYRQLAKENHPDRGGDEKVMVAINNEFDTLFPIWKSRVEVSSGETGVMYRRRFYTQNGWEGKNFDGNLTTKEIAARIRKYVKAVYPTFKFSITCKNYRGIYVQLMETPFDIFNHEAIEKSLERYTDSNGNIINRKAIMAKSYRDMFANDNVKFDYYHGGLEEVKEFFDPYAYKVLEDVRQQVDSYRYNDSDAMIDYFDTNFYPHVGVGQWDKPMKIVPKIINHRDRKSVV